MEANRQLWNQQQKALRIKQKEAAAQASML